MKKIVYTSNTGFTKRYAELLGKATNISVYEINEVKGKINKEDDIIYMGWLIAGSIKKLKKVRRKYNVKAICAVGMGLASKKQDVKIKNKNNITEKLFYLQGGFDKNKQKGIYKLMMDSMEKVIRPKLEAKENKTPEDMEMLEMMINGKDCVKKENLKEVINWIKEN